MEDFCQLNYIKKRCNSVSALDSVGKFVDTKNKVKKVYTLHELHDFYGTDRKISHLVAQLQAEQALNNSKEEQIAHMVYFFYSVNVIMPEF
jgi:hypothetical protein